MKKKWATSLVASALLFGGISTAAIPMTTHAATTPSFTILVEDKEISSDVSPIFVHDRTFVPLRALAESLGATVDYNNTTKTATLTKDSITLVMNFKSGVVKKNGTVITMEEAPRFISDRALVPLRFISQAFGNEVTYNAATHTASVLASEKTLANRAAIKQVLDDSSAVMKDKKSFEMNLNLHGNFPTGEKSMPNLDLTGNMIFDYTMTPIAMYGKGTIKPTGVADLPPQLQNLGLELYLVDGKSYLKDPISGKWSAEQAFDMTELTKMIDMNRQSNAQSDASEKLLLPYMSMTDNGTSYTITTKLDRNGLKKLALSEPTVPGQPPMSDAELQQGLSVYNGMQITITIDKTTHLETGIGMNMDMKMPTGEAVSLSFDGAISKYDAIAPIQVPQDVLDATK
ncbi:MAG: DUF6612 family protein [Tumebacillaceae bacterium]